MNNLVGTSPLVPMPTGAPGVIIKLYFYQNNDDADPDVRKFSVNREELTYDNLTKKIREIYNDTIEECFSVQYLDQDGDKVTFRSTEELNNALNDQVNPPFKFQIKSKRKLSSTDLTSPEGFGEDEIHSGCLCTSCHQNIRGFRYKCLTCCSYDLCHRCEAKGIHPAHDMIRISSASRSYPPHFFSRLQRLWEKNHHQSSHSISSTSSTPPNKSSIILEPIAKDLFVEDAHSDQDDLESFMTAGTGDIEMLRAESSLPSIEELTKNVQSLIDKDNVQENDTESVISVEPKEHVIHETKEALEENHEESKEFDLKERKEENNNEDKEQGKEDVKTEESIIIVEKHELVSLDGTDEAIETALGTETKALAVLESKKLEEPTASLDHNKLPDFNELKKEKGEDDKSRTTLCRLQEEIDKLLAP